MKHKPQFFNLLLLLWLILFFSLGFEGFFLPHPIAQIISYARAETLILTPSMLDTYIAQEAVTQNYGSQTQAIVQSFKNRTTPKNMRAMLCFDLLSLPPFLSIDSATLQLTLLSGTSALNIHRLTGDWMETTVTWGNAPAYLAEYTASGVSSWVVTTDVQYFYDHPELNFGWLLKFPVEDNRTQTMNTYAAKDSVSGWPRLEITYTPIPSIAPILQWTMGPGYEADGVEPTMGQPMETLFSYRVIYRDEDNHPPLSGYPRVHILLGGSAIAGSPFLLTAVKSDDTTYTDGKLYAFSTFLPEGEDYTYYFEAQDIASKTATGEPTLTRCDPLVTNIGLTLYVDPNGNDLGGDGSAINPFATITRALSGAVSGQTVLVRAGTYAERISIRKGVKVISEAGADQTTISGDGSGAVVTLAGQLTGCVLSGLAITGGNLDGGVLVNASGFGVTDSSISNCRIYSNTGPGIKLRGPIALEVTGNELTLNGCAGVSSLVSVAYDLWKDAIGELTGAQDGRRLTLSFRNNSIHHNQGAGLALRTANGGSDYQINLGGSLAEEGNQIFDNLKAGIALGQLGQARIQNNYISNNCTPDLPNFAGIYLLDIAPDPNTPAIIQDNEICDHKRPAIRIEGTSSLHIEGNDLYNNWGGIVLPTFGDSWQWNSRPVLIKGNYIHHNTQGLEAKGGIVLGSPNTSGASLVGKITITQNEIAQNLMAGIAVWVTCEAEISKNNIHESLTRGGIHTGSGSPTLVIKQNKVHHNPDTSFGGGIDVRHAHGQILNNLVYRNERGGLRFGNGIAAIINNTIILNGSLERGGGIIYDDLPEDPNGQSSGSSDGLVIIRNNLSILNETAGLRMGEELSCPENLDAGDGVLFRDYNLLYMNNGTTYDCKWSSGPGYDRSCIQKQYGKCGLRDFAFTLYNPHDLIADPLLVNISLDNYYLQADSLAKGAGYDGADLGAYGGNDPLVDEEIPGW